MKNIEKLYEKKINDKTFDKIVAEIAEMTDNNDHTSALVKGVELLNNVSGKGIKLLKLVKHLADMIEIEGELTVGLDKYKYLKYKDMTKLAKAVLDSDKYETFYNAF